MIERYDESGGREQQRQVAQASVYTGMSQIDSGRATEALEACHELERGLDQLTDEHVIA